MQAPGLPTVLVYCRVQFGSGHWMRTAGLMAGLTHRFRVTAVVDGTLPDDLPIPSGVSIVGLPERPYGAPASMEEIAARADALIRVTDEQRPAAIVLEYFPFGRIEVAHELSRWLHAVRRATPSARPLVVCSLRDIQQRRRPNQATFDRDVVTLTNRYFDAVFVHADPAFVRLEDTFDRAPALAVPVYHTGYIAYGDEGLPATEREPLVVVSAGGGRGGEALLHAAVRAQRTTDLSSDFAVQVVAGALLDDGTWRALEDEARECARLSLVRWVPNLRDALGRAAVSVSRCGYNTALDLVRSRVPALVVPFERPHEDEQAERAGRLARAGLVRVLGEPSALDPERLADEIRRTAAFVPSGTRLDLDGAARSAAILAGLVDAHRAA